ncbi:MAG TPA: hypothetical protein VLQ45_08855 [Thermoanaerobaculia bacterium]|nr:hypothetical protein [Thermoanaerobaculia bacterium]
MSDIPSRDPLEAIACRLLSSERLVSLVRTVLESTNPEGAPDGDAYEAAIDRAYASARKEEKLRRREDGRKAQILSVLEAVGVEGLLRSRRKLSGLAVYEALQERCQAVRHDDPAEMVRLASAATALAEKLSAPRYGEERVIDYQCRAWVELGNAYRVADRLADAEQALARAAQLFLQGTRDDLLEARMYDIQASLYNDCRRPREALEALDTVEAIYLRRGDLHLAGRALISKGMYVGYNGSHEEAIKLTTEGINRLDQQRDPTLVFTAVHNLAGFLIDRGNYPEARLFLRTNRWRVKNAGGQVNSLKVLWLEAQVALGLGNLEEAEQGLLEVRKGFDEAELPYKAALSALELAVVYLRQKRYDEARSTVWKNLDRFVALKIPSEALVSVLVLRRAFEMGTAQGGALLRTVIEFLKRAESDPTVKLDDWI